MASRNLSIGALATLGVAVALAGIPNALEAQERNTRIAWQPFLGCWQPDGADEEQGVLCFVADGAHVEMVTVAGGEITHREPFTADGQLRRIEQDGCTGEESARFSDDYQRIYTTSSVGCAGEPARSGTGIIFMPAGDEWVDVRAMGTGGEEAAAWAQWYVRTGERELNALGIESGRFTAPLAARAMAGSARAPITIEDVIDAARNVDEKAVEAWVAEVGQEFASLDVDDLVRLDDAGVSGDLIDVIVAVSFPERFALNRQGPSAAPDRYFGTRPIWTDPYYSSWGSRYGGYYSGWGYGYGSYYNPYHYPRIIVDVQRIRPAPSGGRVIAGRGYSSGGSSRGFIGSTSSGPSRATVGRSGGSSRGFIGSTSSGPPRATVGGSGGSSGRSSTGRTAKARGGKSGK